MRISEYFTRAAFAGGSSVSIKTQIEDQVSEVLFKELATACAINMIANTVSKCEFRTFVENKKVKGSEYYTWNYSPNCNENSSDLVQKFITNLCYDNEALIVEVNGQLYVADSFYKKEYALKEDVFEGVSIKNLQLQKRFLSSEVIYMNLNNIDAKRRLEGSYTSYGKVVAKSIRDMLRSNGNKGILSIDAITSAQEDFAKQLSIMMNERFKPFFESNQGVLPLTNGYSYTDISKASNQNPSDINERINYEFELAGRSFRIPKALILGDVSDVERITKNFLTFAIDPITEKLGEEITRKRYGEKEFLKGNYLDINTNCIQHIDIFEQSTNASNLVGSGIYCINELRDKLGDTTLEGEWANKHYITKNFSDSEKLDETEKSDHISE